MFERRGKDDWFYAIADIHRIHKVERIFGALQEISSLFDRLNAHAHRQVCQTLSGQQGPIARQSRRPSAPAATPRVMPLGRFDPPSTSTSRTSNAPVAPSAPVTGAAGVLRNKILEADFQGLGFRPGAHAGVVK